ncbi:MAG: alpha/beta hydrolase domain-containing protein [Planctomycetota bacterium]
MSSIRGAVAILAIGTLCAALRAQVDHVAIDRRVDVLGGRAFGEAGAYEKLSGSLHFAFDPDAPGNRAVVDLGLAPRDGHGRVHARADLFVLQPKDQTRRSGIGLLEVSNRGGKGLLPRFCFARGSANPTEAADFGDGLLLEQGLTLIWVGWQWDVPARDGLLRLDTPIAHDGDAPIRGLVRADWTVEQDSKTLELGHRGQIPYAVADTDDPRNVLTARKGPEAPREVVPRAHWQFTEDGQNIALDGGFHAGTIYELVYVGVDPRVVGLGLAAIRDAIAFAKHDASCPFPVEQAIAVGISQSGRFLRHFLWLDFNTDLQDRAVFDGLMVLVAGAGRGSFDHRFAQPSRDGHRLAAFLFPTDLFPFSSRAQEDPVTGIRSRSSKGAPSTSPG